MDCLPVALGSKPVPQAQCKQCSVFSICLVIDKGLNMLIAFHGNLSERHLPYGISYHSAQVNVPSSTPARQPMFNSSVTVAVRKYCIQ